jgi:hypothetical protein
MREYTAYAGTLTNRTGAMKMHNGEKWINELLWCHARMFLSGIQIDDGEAALIEFWIPA